MKKPNLFIVGAPKCATTALHAYLAQHSSCFMSRVKEPGYFTRENVLQTVRVNAPYLNNEESYLALFREATAEHLVIGESSTSYMRSLSALREIHRFSKEARIIAMVRDPVTLVSSYYHFLRFQGWEPIASLRGAWRDQDARCAGKILSTAANRPDSLAYRNVAMLGSQVQNLFSIFGRENVFVIVQDDLKEQASEIGLSVQKFLRIPNNEALKFPVANPARSIRWPLLNKIANSQAEVLVNGKNALKRLLGVRSLGVRKAIESVGERRIHHEVEEGLAIEMRTYFQADVELLSTLLDRDLFELWRWTRQRNGGVRI